jgi:hypothetical protein
MKKVRTKGCWGCEVLARLRPRELRRGRRIVMNTQDWRGILPQRNRPLMKLEGGPSSSEMRGEAGEVGAELGRWLVVLATMPAVPVTSMSWRGL